MKKVLLFSLLFVMSLQVFGGSLEPSAGPGSTMKTLDEVEPRIAIQSLTDDVDYEYLIKSSGSYYLTGNVITTKGGINVGADDVTIDLMGYSLVGSGSGQENYNGINIDGHSNVEVRNGTVRNFGGYGIGGINGRGHRIVSVRAIMNSFSGIHLNDRGHLVKDCTATGNGTGSGTGIYAEDGSTITGNTVYDNGSHGIEAGWGNTVTGNTLYRNRGCGIYAGSSCTVTGNTARDNNQTNNASNAGIWVQFNCMVKGNTLKGNLQHNIYVDNSDNAIEENLVTNSAGNGIYFNAAGNFYANNRASGNTINYANTVGQTDGGGNASF